MSVRQIVALLAGLVGLGATFGATVSNEWKSTSRASSVITATWIFQGLWMNCAGNAIGSVHCRQHHTIFKLEVYIHLCRALIITSIILGLFGDILALVGMKCTKLGGSEIVNARVTVAAGINYLASGFCAMFAFSWYGNKVISEFQDPNHRTQKFELGSALFIGWGGSALLMVGGLLYNIFAVMEGCQSSPQYQGKLVPSTYEVPSSSMLESSKQVLTLPPSALPDKEGRKEEERKSRHFSQAYQKDEYV
ncbi:claudin-7-like isoform X5 [Brachyhypopomus gauderio]|uniref:claudin-7-like isoform X5 n=1 Tax=Brachyhypopomus gauderio TaxID=698409 RepID=UPI0040411A6B